MQKSIVPVQPNLDVMRQNGCHIQIQRPKKHRNHTHHLCISKKFFVTQWIDLNIYIIEHFSYVMNSFNGDNVSISIILDGIMLFYHTLLGTYSNNASFKPFLWLSLSPRGVYSRGGGYCKNELWHGGLFQVGLNRGEGAKMRTYNNLQVYME